MVRVTLSRQAPPVFGFGDGGSTIVQISRGESFDEALHMGLSGVRRSASEGAYCFLDVAAVVSPQWRRDVGSAVSTSPANLTPSQLQRSIIVCEVVRLQVEAQRA